MRGIKGLADVNTDQQNKGLQTKLNVDRDTASRLGISMTTIDNTLYDAFGQRQVSTIYKSMNQYHVVMQVEPEFSQNPDSLRHIFIRGLADAQIPLGTLYRQTSANSALAANHSGVFPSVTISFNLKVGTALGDVVPKIEEAATKLGIPESIQGRFQGTAQAFQDSLRNQPLLFLAALVTVYIVLGVLYESYIHPITIISTLFPAGVGALLALILCGTELNVMAMIGILLLIGIVKKNAIMMIDFALEAERNHGKTPEEAIFEACILRFRPITMTTMAALLGGLPLALGTGEGAELRKPMGIAIVGGLIFSQMLTLYTTPVVYLYFDWLCIWCDQARSDDVGHDVSISTIRLPTEIKKKPFGGYPLMSPSMLEIILRDRVMPDRRPHRRCPWSNSKNGCTMASAGLNSSTAVIRSSIPLTTFTATWFGIWLGRWPPS